LKIDLISLISSFVFPPQDVQLLRVHQLEIADLPLMLLPLLGQGGLGGVSGELELGARNLS